MIRDLRLFLWLRRRLWFGSLRRASSMGVLSSLGASLSGVVFLLGLLFLLVVAVALLAAAVAWSRAVSSPDPSVAGPAVLLLRLALGVLLFLLVILPASRAGTGSLGLARGGLTRVLLSPLPRRHLHALESLSHAFDPLILVTAPALFLLGFLVGRNVGGVGLVLAMLAILATIVSLILFSALVGIGLQVLLGNRRQAEWMMLLTLLVVTLGSMVPVLLPEAALDFDPSTSAAAEPGAVPGPDGEALLTFPWWLQWLPSESLTRTLVVLAAGRPLAALPSVFALALFSGACWVLSRRLWNRLIASPGMTTRSSSGQARKVGAGALLGLSLQTTAVAIATVRTFLRTVRGKLAMILTPILVVVLGVAFDLGERSVPTGGVVGALLGGRVTMLASIAISMSVLNLLPILANVFAADREGLTRQALTPISRGQWIVGKAVGLLLLYAAALLPALGVVAVWTGPDVVALSEAILRGLATIACMIPVGLWVSLLFPRTVDLNSLGKQGNPHTLAQFFSFLALAVVLLGGSLAPVVAEIVLGTASGRLIGAALFALAMMGIAVPMLTGAARLLQDRLHAVAVLVNG